VTPRSLRGHTAHVTCQFRLVGFCLHSILDRPANATSLLPEMQRGSVTVVGQRADGQKFAPRVPQREAPCSSMGDGPLTGYVARDCARSDLFAPWNPSPLPVSLLAMDEKTAGPLSPVRPCLLSARVSLLLPAALRQVSAHQCPINIAKPAVSSSSLTITVSHNNIKAHVCM
jgi:hypothetical protein